ncbi:uncharacterized protein Triagg1_6231 [Trichoderma aggressivum f. europaeum]|uniref:BZIP domain-containing protein n=1 Tax=Trichoderma aggressivum f. europaeum TaxID=173218 RepID=A0AAE1M437_9HYPO|nr:hypothetical protein Triagg1_6231 [Trichoderma aggressivum f. europaeum]
MSDTTSLESEATETLNAVNRRRLQNRLNQRASPDEWGRGKGMRKKELQKQQQQDKNQVSKWVFYVDPRTEDAQQDGRPLDRKRYQWRLAQTRPASSLDEWKESGSELAVASGSCHSPSISDVFLSPKYRDEMFRFFCKLSTTERGVFYRRLYELVTRHVAQRTLDSQLLLSVMQFNVIRAAGVNAAAIGIGMDLMAEDVISPFYAGVGTQLTLPGSTTTYGKELQHLPPNLQPTALQKLVIHHPWIDVCAQPSLRDALLRRLHNLNEDEFCHHLFLQHGESDKDGMIGMVVWGEAWDAASYEISATMVRKWPWIVNECPDIIRTTNYWRAKRQEGPLKIL